MLKIIVSIIHFTFVSIHVVGLGFFYCGIRSIRIIMQTLRNSANPYVFITISKSHEAAISLISAMCVWVWVSLGVCVRGVGQY